MKLRCIMLSLSAFAGCAFMASALSVNVVPGGLREAIGSPVGVTQLNVTGSIDITDLEFIASEMRDLVTLDLSEVNIAAYRGKATFLGRTEAPANVLPDYSLLSGSFTSVALPVSIESIGEGALGNTMITSIVIPSAVTSISAGAFSGCKRLTAVTVPSSVKSIGKLVFKDCQELVNAVIKAPVAELPADTFYGCGKLTSVELPSSVAVIGDRAFAGCVALSSITLPTGLQSIGNYAFAATGLTSLDLESLQSLAVIGDWAFADCNRLSAVNCPQSVTRMGEGVFFNNTALSVNLASSVALLTDVPDFMFTNTAAMQTDNFESTSVESIGNSAFANSSMEKITFPHTLTSLSDYAMMNVGGLKEVNVEGLSDVPSVGENVWDGVDQSNVSLIVPALLFNDYKNAPQWKEFNVKLSQTGLNEITADNQTGNSVQARFEGSLLILTASMDIVAVQLYDASGRCFNMPEASPSATVTVDTAPWDASVFIVRVLLSDASVVTLKLAR